MLTLSFGRPMGDADVLRAGGVGYRLRPRHAAARAARALVMAAVEVMRRLLPARSGLPQGGGGAGRAVRWQGCGAGSVRGERGSGPAAADGGAG